MSTLVSSLVFLSMSLVFSVLRCILRKPRTSMEFGHFSPLRVFLSGYWHICHGICGICITRWFAVSCDYWHEFLSISGIACFPL
jgi:hypothetical protein